VLPNSALPLWVSAAAFADASGASTALVTTGVELRLDDPRERRVLTVVTSAFDPKGRQVGEAIPKTLEISPRSLASGMMTVSTPISLRPGRYEIRVAVHDQGRATFGSVFTFIDVPEFEDEVFVLSDLVVEHLEGASPAAPVRDSASNSVTLLRTFTSAGRVAARLRVYQRGREAPQPAILRFAIVDARDEVVREEEAVLSVEAFVPSRTTDYLYVVPTRELSPGEYLLRVVAASGNRTAERVLRFAVHATLPLP
jgi:hypothetical protein